MLPVELFVKVVFELIVNAPPKLYILPLLVKELELLIAKLPEVLIDKLPELLKVDALIDKLPELIIKFPELLKLPELLIDKLPELLIDKLPEFVLVIDDLIRKLPVFSICPFMVLLMVPISVKVPLTVPVLLFVNK